jgi:signal transduction histidine kinase
VPPLPPSVESIVVSRRLRWLSILVPLAVIAAIEGLSDTVFDEVLPFPRDTILVVAVVAVIGVIGGIVAWRAIDRLTATLQASNRELQAREESTRALHQVSMAVATLADLDAILEVICGSARRLLVTDAAALVLTGPDGRPALVCSSGPVELLLPEGDGSAAEDDVGVRAFLAPAVETVLGAPLQRGGATIGALGVGSRQQRSFSIDEVELLSSLANQAAIAIENARLHDQLRELAVRGERERIARELHDGLAQVLGYVNTKSQAVEELLAAGRIEEARVHLAELASAARSIYVDVREAILGLSTPVSSAGLSGTIERYATRFAEASKLAVHVNASPGAARLDLPPAVEAQVFRIVQEALTNVRKHAAAQRVEVDLDVLDGSLIVAVEDDGRGLGAAESAGEGWPRYGATAMRERARSIGGSVVWSSVPGAGTRVRLDVPLSGRPVAAEVGA